jgi:endonuclease YncB( thermonuclease family)
MAGRKASQDHDGTSSKGSLGSQLGRLAGLAIVLCLVLVYQRYCTVKPPPFGPGAHIVTMDGDTLRAGNGVAYRLFAIDAPELKQTCKEANGKSWLCGRAAKARLTMLIKGGNVNCEAREKDRLGRIVAVCHAEGVPDLSEAMVRQGYAAALPGPEGNPYADAQAEAKAKKRGIWRGTFEQPSDWRQAHPRDQ